MRKMKLFFAVVAIACMAMLPITIYAQQDTLKVRLEGPI